MKDFGEVLKLCLMDSSPLTGNASFVKSTIRPTNAGFSVLAVPSRSNSAGLAFRINGTLLEQLSLVDNTLTVEASIALTSSTNHNSFSSAVHVSASFDGRLVCVACLDGSLQCYDALITSKGKALTLRWSLANAHSHVADDASTSPPSSRAFAASESGPVRSLAFAPHGYTLLLVNANSNTAGQLQVYNAAEMPPSNFFLPHLLQQQIQQNEIASCASWSSNSNAVENSNSGCYELAVGDTGGNIHIYQVLGASIQPIVTIPFPGTEMESEVCWACTHLDWCDQGNSLGAGYCRVIPSSGDEDEDDEDCRADHEAIFFVADMENNQPTKWVEFGDIVPFFSIPRHGRHAFFTAYCSTQQGASFLVVACNVSSDIAVLAKGGPNHRWELAEIPDGSNPTTPTDEDDQYTFPTGLATISAAGSGRMCLLLASTDGSLSTFQFSHEEEAEFFTLTNTQATALEDAPVPKKVLMTIVTSLPTTNTGKADRDAGSPDLELEPPLLVKDGQPQLSQPSQLATVGMAFPAPPPSTGSAPFSFDLTPTKINSDPNNVNTVLSYRAPTAAVTSSFGNASSGTGTKPSGSPSAVGAGVSSSVTSTSSIFGVSPTGIVPAVASSGEAGFGSAISIFGGATKSQAGAGGFASLAKSTRVGGFGFDVGAGTVNSKPASSFSTFGGPPRVTMELRCGEDDTDSDADANRSGSETESEKEEGALAVAPIKSAFNFGTSTSPSLFINSNASVPEKSSALGFGSTGSATLGSGSHTPAFSFGGGSPFARAKNGVSTGGAGGTAEVPSHLNTLGAEIADSLHQVTAKHLFGLVSKEKSQGAVHSVAATANAALPPNEDGKLTSKLSIALTPKSAAATPPASNTKWIVKKAEGVFDSFDTEKKGILPISKFEDTQDALGEGFHGAEMQEQIKIVEDPNFPGSFSRKAFIDWYVNLVENPNKLDKDKDSVDSDEEEKEEEREKASKAFLAVAKKENGEDVVDVEDFGKLLSSMDTTYCEEEHGTKTINKLKRVTGKIHYNDFVKWYVEWLFSDEESDEDEGEHEKPSSVDSQETPRPCPSSSRGTKNSWGDTFKVADNLWQCKTCMVMNDGELVACASCTVPKPGCEGKQKELSGSPAATVGASSIGKCGFVFGSGNACSTSNSKLTFGTPGAPSSGFTFRSAAAKTASASPAPCGGFDSGFSTSSTSGSGISFGNTTAQSTNPINFIAGFPPMASEAPTALSAMPSSPAGAAFLPLADKARTPLTQCPSTESTKPASSSSGSAFPPMASKAPTSFSVSASIETVKLSKPVSSRSGEAFPPMPIKAPAAVSATATVPGAKPASATSGGAFLPMASLVGNPFSVRRPNGTGKPSVPASSNVAAAFPPMASKAPTPFNVSVSTETVQRVMPGASSSEMSFPPVTNNSPRAVKAIMLASTSGGASPPMAKEAPAPVDAGACSYTEPGSAENASSSFGALSHSASLWTHPSSSSPSGIFTHSVTGGKHASIVTSSSPFGALLKDSTSAQFASSSSHASIPVAQRPTKGTTPPQSTKVLSSTKVYKPTLSIAPKAVSAASKSGGSSGRLSGSTINMSETTCGQPPTKKEFLTYSSECDRQLAAFVEGLNETLAQLAQGRPDSKYPLQDTIEQLVGDVTRLEGVCSECRVQISENAQRSAFLLSRKTDTSRQASEAQRLIDSSLQSQAKEVFASQPLDRDSETHKRQLASRYVNLRKRLQMLENRLKIIATICASDSTQGRNVLLSMLLKSFNLTKLFRAEPTRINRKVSALTRKVPQLKPRTVASPRSARGRGGRKPVRIPPSQSGSDEHQSVHRQAKGGNDGAPLKRESRRWVSVESSILNLTRNEPAKRTRLCLFSLSSTSPKQIQQKAPARSPAQHTFLLPAATAASPGLAVVSKDEASRQNPPLPPLTTKTRPGWDKPSELDRAKQITLSLPRDIQELTFADAARSALESFGTTPEKVRESIETTRRGVLPKQPSRPRSGSSKETKTEGKSRSSQEKKKPAVADFPPVPTRAFSNPFSSVADAVTDRNEAIKGKGEKANKHNGSSFPPLSKHPPTLLSNSIAQSLKAPSVPSLSVKDALSSAALLTAAEANSGSEKVPSGVSRTVYALSEVGGTGNSFFARSEGKELKTSENTNIPAACEATGSIGSSKEMSPTHDYRKMLTDFYKSHKPENVAKVDGYLQKFKNNEAELFKKLAAKYGVLNPLEGNIVGCAAFSTPCIAGKSPFSISSRVSTSTNKPTSLLGNSPPPAAPSPFGNMDSKRIGGNAGAQQSPFGIAMSSPAFGAAFGTQTSSITPSMPSLGENNNSQGMSSVLSTPMSQQSYAGVSPREMLTAFYRKHKPEKVAEVDKLLIKYAGKEEKLFQNLASKYNLDPSIFGVSAQQQAPAPGQVGSLPASSFGQASVLGGSASPFQASSGFGQPSSLGQSMSQSTGVFGLSSGGSTFGQASGTSFGGGGFGALAQGSGVSFGSSPPGSGMSFASGGTPFGTATPFGAPRR